MADADRNEIDHRVHSGIEPKYGTVFQACLNSTTGPEDVLKAVHEEVAGPHHAKLGDARSGLADFAAMFQERFRTPQAAEQGRGGDVPRSRAEAGSARGPGSEVKSLWSACPGGREGEALRELARRAIPVAGLPFADTFDALNVIANGRACRSRRCRTPARWASRPSRTPRASTQCRHARVDVEMWTEIDAP